MQLTRENLYDIVNIGLPIFLLIISIFSFIWFGLEIKKKRIEFKSMVTWLGLNILFTIVIIYILIIAILHYYGVDNAVNIFNIIAFHLFGLSMDNGKEWVILLILAFISYILIKTLRNSILISRLNKRVDALGKEVALLSGKVNKSADFANKVAKPKSTAQDVKSELKEKIKIAKAEKRAAAKLKTIKTKKKNSEK